MKERVTLTIEKDLLEKVDQSIDGSKIKNRSHAVELLITKALGTHKPTKALILAGGKGIRLRASGEETPACMMRFKDKPILEYNIELLKKYGINEIYLFVGENSGAIESYFGDGRRPEVQIQYVKEKAALGTAGPLRAIRSQVKETFV